MAEKKQTAPKAVPDISIDTISFWETKHNWPPILGENTDDVRKMRFHYVQEAHYFYPKMALKFRNLLIDYLSILKRTCYQRFWIESFGRGFAPAYQSWAYARLNKKIKG